MGTLLGLTLLGLLAIGAIALRRSPKLRAALRDLPAFVPLADYAPKARSFADLLPYGPKIAANIQLNTDGSLTASYRYHGPDLQSAPGRERDQLGDRFNEFVRGLKEGWMLHFCQDAATIGGYLVDGTFRDPTAWTIDEERRAAFTPDDAQSVNEYHLDITYLPQTDRSTKGQQLLMEGQTGGLHDAAADAVKTFEQTLRDFEGVIGPELHLERLTQRWHESDHGAVLVDDQKSHLLRCATNERVLLAATPPQSHVGAELAMVDLRAGFRLRVGEWLVAIIAITDMPAEVMDGALACLDQTNGTFRVCRRYIVRDPNLALRDIQRERSRWFGRRRGLGDALQQRESPLPNQDAIAMAAEAGEAEAELASGRQAFGYYTINLQLWERIAPLPTPAPDVHGLSPTARKQRCEDEAWQRLIARTDTIRAEIHRNHFATRLERENAMEAFLGALPAVGYANVRRPMLGSRNLASLVPLTSPWNGSPSAPCPFYPRDSTALAQVSTPAHATFFLNLHDSIQRDVGHTLMAGETGAGKSTCLGFLIAQHRRYRDSIQIIFDVGYSHLTLTLACGGVHYDVGRDAGSLRFAPLAHIDRPRERLWAELWLLDMLERRGVPNPVRKQRNLVQALEYLARAERPWSLTKLLTQPGIDQEIREALEFYTVAGPTQGLLDGEDDHLERASISCFEMGALLDQPEGLKVPTLTYLIHRVEDMLDGSPAMVVLDEVWKLLDQATMTDAIKNWLKTLRKRNGICMFATQSLVDLVQSPIKDTLIGSCPTKILLSNPNALTPIAKPLYTAIGLQPWQIRHVARGTLKSDYFLMQTAGQCMMRNRMTDVALAFIGVSDPSSVARVRQLVHEEAEQIREHGVDATTPWQERWLRERIPGPLGHAWADYWRERWTQLGGYASFPPAGLRDHSTPAQERILAS